MYPPRLDLEQKFESPVLRTFIQTLRRGNFDSPFYLGIPLFNCTHRGCRASERGPVSRSRW